MVEEDIRKITGVITAVTPILERLNRKDSLAKIQERDQADSEYRSKSSYLRGV